MRAAAALLAALLAAGGRAAHPGGADVSVTAYGARPSDPLPCTVAFQRAIDAVAARGGGVVRVPSGVYVTGPLNLTSNLVFWLAAGAVLRADVNRSRLPLLPALPSWGPASWDAAKKVMRPQADLRDAIPRYQALLYGLNVENVTITGENGTLDGTGLVWWKRWLVQPLYGRPHLIEFENSRSIRIRNVTLRNPGFWSVHLWKCQYVTVQFLTILVTPWDPPVRPTNTDGVNPDSSQHVLIEDSYFQTGDDAVAIKSGWDCFGRAAGIASRNITVRRIVVRQTRGCNAAGVTIGSEMSGGVQDVLIEDAHFLYTGAAVEIKVGTVRGGYVRGIRVRNILVEETSRSAVVVMASYPEGNPFCQDLNPPAPLVSGVSFDRVRVRGPTRGNLVMLEGAPTVFLQDIRVTNLTGSGDWQCNFVAGMAANNTPPACPALQPARRKGVRQGVGPRLKSMRWRNDGRCGKDYPAGKGGAYARCPTAEEYRAEKDAPWRVGAEPWLETSPCCGPSGWCGSEAMHCACEGCVDYRFLAFAPAEPIPEPTTTSLLPSTTTRLPTASLAGPPAQSSTLRPTSVTTAAGRRDLRPRRGMQRRYSGLLLPSLESFRDPPMLGLVAQGLSALAILSCMVVTRFCVPALQQHWYCRKPQLYMVGLLGWTALQSGFFVVRSLRVSAAARYVRDSRGGWLGSPPGPASPISTAPPQPGPHAGGRQEGPVVGGDPRASAVEAEQPCRSPPAVGPVDFGAVGDGRADDTAAVLAALQHGSRCGGTVVIGPSGRTFAVAPGALRVELHGVTVRFEGDLLGPTLAQWNPYGETWPAGSCAYGESRCSTRGTKSPEFARSQWTLLHLQSCSNVTVQGPGGLRAPGRSFWAVRNARPAIRGYCLLKLDGCEQVQVSGLRLADSPMYQVVVMESRDVRLEHLNITVEDVNRGDRGPHNTDGVSIIASRGITLQHSHIESGDDNVVIKEGSRDIFGSDLELIRGKGISIGSLGERGTEDQVVTDVVFQNVSLHFCVHGARIKTWKGGRGLVQNVTFRDFKVRGVAHGILVDQMYCPLSQRPEGCADVSRDAIRITDVHFTNFSGTYWREAKSIACVRCSGVEYQGISLRKKDVPWAP